MARPKEFDVDTAIEDALQSFWTNGYAATSMQDLVSATGVNRASLYGTFDSKAGLYERALDRYGAAGCAQLERHLEGDDDLVDRLLAYADELFAAPDGRGCFIGNSLCELVDSEPSLHASAVVHADRVRGQIRDAASTAIVAGESLVDSPDVVADVAMAAIHGAQVMSKAGVDSDRLRDGLRVSLGALRS